VHYYFASETTSVCFGRFHFLRSGGLFMALLLLHGHLSTSETREKGENPDEKEEKK